MVSVMGNVLPAFALVRPRAAPLGGGEAQLLEDILAEHVDEPGGVLRIVGPPGSGKTTAISHLAAVFADDQRLEFIDQPSDEDAAPSANHFAVLSAASVKAIPGVTTVRLAPWGFDELVEYLLAKHPAACRSVLNRLGGEARRAWIPEIAVVVLDRFAANEAATNPSAELGAHLQELLPIREQLAAAKQSCLAVLAGGTDAICAAAARLAEVGCSEAARSLLRHRMVQAPLAVDRVIESLCEGDEVLLRPVMPFDLVELAGIRCRGHKAASSRLYEILNNDGLGKIHPMAASILRIADPAWRPRPGPGRQAWQLAGAHFSGVVWPLVNLASANLSQADFSDAFLETAVLTSANASEARFNAAVLRKADLARIQAGWTDFIATDLSQSHLSEALLVGADLTNANLKRADLTGANLSDAQLSDANLTSASAANASFVGSTLTRADFTNAMLRDARLTGLDLRTVCLEGACLERAKLERAQLEDVVLPKAQLRGATLTGAHLTGSRMPLCDLREADLSGAGLAEIEWEGADLRGANLHGATFHMGSSRSGLVGSPIACEGSKTGFYTDDFEDMHFKRPEEIRKANLRGADLRGANITGLDFYLVDLRDAQLDAAQREHVCRCGAILKDAAAS